MRGLFALLFTLLVACGGNSSFELGGQAPVEVRTAIDGTVTARGGRFVLVVDQDADLEVAWPDVLPTRLEVQPDGEIREERVGGRLVRTQRFVFTGTRGSHVIPAVTAEYTSPDGVEKVSSQPLYVDLGVKAPRPGELADIPDPEAQGRWPWVLILTVLTVVGLFVIGLWIAFRGSEERALAAVPPEPPDVVALRAWEAVAASELGDLDKALAISRIFRDYAEAVLAFKATAKTTTEILERLRSMVHLEAGNVPRAKRLLRATDRIKFAEVSAGKDLFEDLDADLRAFVASTRPHHWEPEVVEERRVTGGTDWSHRLLFANRVASGGAFGAGVMTLLFLVRWWREQGLPPFLWTAATLAFVGFCLVLGAVHASLASSRSAPKLRWLQVFVSLTHIVMIPVGPMYSLFVWFALSKPEVRRFYSGAP